MSKRIVVGLDGSSYAEAAIDAAIERASRSGGTVVGVAVIDRPGIEKSVTGAGVGSASFTTSTINSRLSDAATSTRDYLNHFAERCRTAGVKFELTCEEGVPFDAMIEYGRASDLMIIGQRTFFHGATDSKGGDTIERLLHYPVTPILAVPETWIAPKHVIIGYNRSVPATRAMGAFLHQQSITPFAEDITLLYADEKEPDESMKHELDLAEKYLAAYGLKVNRLVKKGDESEALLESARELEPCMIVIGVSERNWLSELFSDSIADELIRACKVPLFVFN